MDRINKRALTIKREFLLEEIKKANDEKLEILSARDKKYGSSRPLFGSYMENIALPELFGFDMIDYYKNPEFSMEIDLRHKLFWLDNSHDDKLAELSVGAGTMYFDITLFGMNIEYTKEGVPRFSNHILQNKPDLSLLKPFDFEETGEMPMVINRYKKLINIEESEGGEIKVDFPFFHRGPLDIAIALRGYENFITDCVDYPENVHNLLSYIVEERKRYNDLSIKYQNREGNPPANFVADDWVNVPFITPDLFDQFVVPAYMKIQENEGLVKGFHTCGMFTPVLKSLLSTFNRIETLDISGWNDFLEVHRLVSGDKILGLNFKNTFVILGTPEEHKAMYKTISTIIKDGRKITLMAQAIEKMTGTIFDSITAMNNFIDSAREYFSGN
jgi:uroporphyrinogen-III decarboxylase